MPALPLSHASSPPEQPAIARYVQALDALDAVPDGGDLSDMLFAAAHARDDVAADLAGGADRSAESLSQLAAQDTRLRERAKRFGTQAGLGAFTAWRDALQPEAAAWWWMLDAPEEPTPHPLWPVLSGALITLAVSLATDVSLRLLAGRPDLLGLLSTFAQAVLALLAGSAFTRVGSEKVESLLGQLHVARARHPAWKTLLAAALLLVVVALWSAMPRLARWYSDRGMQRLQHGEVAAARDAFDRAVRLDPGLADAHYNLAVAHEELLDFDLAIPEYQLAIRLNDGHYPAYNNLARLYLLRKGDGASALALTGRALAKNPVEASVRYSLLKNRSWAQWQLGHLLQAEEGLKEAIAIPPAGHAAAQCLLAQVLEAHRPPSDEQARGAAEAWTQCVALAADPNEVVEPVWLSLAEERLRGAPR
ncbi:MAG: tetratricopeptide repeat protein [Burkholderiales bacterium]|jgi:Tfp pilus assembly protein PilF|nr:tetratricopeptide repeat protein [Burkholderiales bacterium]